MSKLHFVISLTTRENDFQIEQAEAAKIAADRLGVEIDVLYAENDAIQQSQQLLSVIQSKGDLPHGIIFESAGGTGFPQVANAAVNSRVAWVILNREVDYIGNLRQISKVPVFSVSSDHEEIGRIQGRQLAALLPKGGSALLIEGPAEATAAKRRTAGIADTMPPGLQLKTMKGNWTELGAYRLVSSWLKLKTSLQLPLDVVVSQNDAMAIGARRAFQEIPDESARKRFAGLRYIGVDGVPTTGQTWLKKGVLSATVVVSPNTDIAMEMLTRALGKGVIHPETTLTIPKSLPTVEELATRAAIRSDSASA